MTDCTMLPPVAEAGTVARAMDLFAMFGVSVVVASCIAAVIVLYLVFRTEQDE
jgi:hypothetical protein